MSSACLWLGLWLASSACAQSAATAPAANSFDKLPEVRLGMPTPSNAPAASSTSLSKSSASTGGISISAPNQPLILDFPHIPVAGARLSAPIVAVGDPSPATEPSMAELALPDELLQSPNPQTQNTDANPNALPGTVLDLPRPKAESQSNAQPGTSPPEEISRPDPVGEANTNDFYGIEALPSDLFDSLPNQSGSRPESILETQPKSTETSKSKQDAEASTKTKLPEFFVPPSIEPYIQNGTYFAPYDPSAFAPMPNRPLLHDPVAQEQIYRGKFPVPTQRPWVELGRPLYTTGLYPPGRDLLGPTNLLFPHFMVYGDFRTGVGINRNVAGDANNWANRLNLDMDLKLTATERLHAFMAPLDRNGDFTRLDFTNSAEFLNRTDMRLDTLFFEGDAGAILGGLNGIDSPFDLPFSFGFMPLIYQNGIWANDNVIGAAMAIPAQHSNLFGWSNYDATFFWASDQVTTDAFAGDNNAAEFFGTAWFIDAYEGYIEADYAFVHDDVGGHRSYHNLSFAFTRRYFARLSNSVRFITNFGQALPDNAKTASGHLVIIENSLISRNPNTMVPYCNLFYGQGRPQSLARAGVAGGILNNTGINFETDGLNGYPTLDPTGHNAYGGAIGLNLLGANFSHQLVVEAAVVQTVGSAAFRNAAGDQYALGVRYQKPLNNAWLFRTDHMYGWLQNAQDIRGSRVELRWKF